MRTLQALVATLATWVAYQLATPYLSTAVVLVPAVAYYFWHQQQTARALAVLFGGALLVDLSLPQVHPLYLTVSFLAGLSYLGLIEKRLSLSGSLGATLGLLSWLVAWRIWYLSYVLAAAAFQHSGLPTVTSVLRLTLTWLGCGLVTWSVLELGGRARQRSRRQALTYGAPT